MEEEDEIMFADEDGDDFERELESYMDKAEKDLENVETDMLTKRDQDTTGDEEEEEIVIAEPTGDPGNILELAASFVSGIQQEFNKADGDHPGQPPPEEEEEAAEWTAAPDDALPQDVIILVDNREKNPHLVKEIRDALRKESADPRHRSDKRFQHVHVCGRTDWDNLRKNLGIRTSKKGGEQTSTSQYRVELRSLDEDMIVQSAISASGLISASFPIGDFIYLNERGQVLRAIEHKTENDFNSGIVGARHEDMSRQIEEMWLLGKGPAKIPVEFVISGNLIPEKRPVAKAIITKILSSDVPWASTYFHDLLPWYLIQRGLWHLDPSHRHTREKFLASDILVRVTKVKEMTPLSKVKADLLNVPGVDIETVKAFISAGIRSPATLISEAQRIGREGFANLKTENTNKSGETVERRIGVKGERVYDSLGINETPVPFYLVNPQTGEVSTPDDRLSKVGKMVRYGKGSGVRIGFDGRVLKPGEMDVDVDDDEEAKKKKKTPRKRKQEEDDGDGGGDQDEEPKRKKKKAATATAPKTKKRTTEDFQAEEVEEEVELNIETFEGPEPGLPEPVVPKRALKKAPSSTVKARVEVVETVEEAPADKTAPVVSPMMIQNLKEQREKWIAELAQERKAKETPRRIADEEEGDRGVIALDMMSKYMPPLRAKARDDVKSAAVSRINMMLKKKRE